MMELGDAGPPSIPTQVADMPLYCVACTVGTTQSAWTALYPLPTAIWPDQLVDCAAYELPATCGFSGVTKCPGPVCSCIGEEANPWPDCCHCVCASCAPATEAPITRPTAMSASALSHRHT